MSTLFKMSDLMKHFGCSEYRIEKMLAKGILDPPLPRDSESETRIWTSTHVNRADERIRQLSTPAPRSATSTVRLSEKMKAKIRAHGRPLKVY